MIFSADNHMFWHYKTLAEHDALIAQYTAKDFCPISLSIYGTDADQRMAAVMIRPAAKIVCPVVTNKNFVELTHVIDAMNKAHLAPYLISARGAPDAPVYAMAFRPMPSDLVIAYNKTPAQFRQMNLDRHAAGMTLVSMDAFGTAQDTRYCAIWLPASSDVAWNMQAMDDSPAAFQQRIATMADSRARPALIACTPSGGHAAMFVDSRLETANPTLPPILQKLAWDYAANQPDAALTTTAHNLAGKGLFPIAISGRDGPQPGPLSAIFARGDGIKPRAFSHVSKAAAPEPPIDAAMQKFMQAHGYRGAALAIVHGTKLVYAMGYTNAEDDYPQVLDTTLYRQASISKIFVATAIWKLIEQGKLTPDTTMQSILKLTQPKTDAPATVSPKYGGLDQVTVRHLLESRSGIDQGTCFRSASASNAAGGTLPSDAWEIARLIAVDGLQGKPGDNFNTVYGNTDCALLGLIASAVTRDGKTGVDPVTGSDGVFEAIKALVLDPLGMTMTRQARSLKADQDPQAALHLRHNYDPNAGIEPLNMGNSLRTPDTPIVAEAYGAFDYESATSWGGLTASVVDVARITAMFACRGNNPVLKPDTLDLMLVTGAEAYANGKHWTTHDDGTQACDPAHGCYNGFDRVGWQDVAKRVVRLEKGGSIATVGTLTTSWYNSPQWKGFTWIVALSGDNKPGDTTDWLQPVMNAAKTGLHDVDLFPIYGMTALDEPLPPGAPAPALSDDAISKRVFAPPLTPPKDPPTLKAPAAAPLSTSIQPGLPLQVRQSMELQMRRAVPVRGG